MVKKTKQTKPAKAKAKSNKPKKVDEIVESVVSDEPSRDVRNIEVEKEVVVVDEVVAETVEQPVSTEVVEVLPQETVPPPVIVREGNPAHRIAYQVKRLRDAENAANVLMMRRRGRR